MAQRSDIRLIVCMVTIIGLLPVLFAGHAGAQLAVIQLEHRPANEIIPVIQPFLGPGDTLSGKDFLIFLNATPEHRARIEAIIANLDRAAQQLAITVVQGEDALATMNRLAVSGKVTIGDNVVVGVGDRHGSADDHLAVDIRHGNRTQKRSDIQRILVRDGATARVHVGLSVPVSRERFDPKHRRHREVYSVRDVSTGVSVTPRLAGDRVILNLDARQERPADAGSRAVQTQQIHTQIAVRLNEWTDIGKILSASSRNTTGTIHNTTGTHSSRGNIFVRVESVP